MKKKCRWLGRLWENKHSWPDFFENSIKPLLFAIYAFCEKLVLIGCVLSGGLYSQWRPEKWSDLSVLNTFECCALFAGCSVLMVWMAILLLKNQYGKIAMRLLYAVFLYWSFYGMCKCGIHCVPFWCIGFVSLFVFLQVTKEEKTSIKHGLQSDGVGRSYMYERVADSLRRKLVDAEKEKHSHGVVAAVFGAWGSGKSHCVQTLIGRLEKAFDCGVVNCGEVNLWDCETPEQAWKITEQALCKACGIVPHASVADLMKWFPIFASAAYPANKAIKELVRQTDITLSSPSVGAELAGYLTSHKQYAILVFEDIERVPSNLFRQLLPLLQRLHAVRRLLVICSVAVDELMSRSDLDMQPLELQGYFDKLFDFSYYMPPLLQENARAYFKSYIENNYQGNTPLLLATIDKLSWQFDTVRQIERVADYLAGAEAQYFGNGRISEADMAAYFSVLVLRLMFYPVLQEMRENRWFDFQEGILKAEKERFAQLFPLLNHEARRSKLFTSLLDSLKKQRGSVIKQALEMKYAYFNLLSDVECEKLLNIHSQKKDLSAEELVKEGFRDTISDVDLTSLATSLFSYLFNNSYMDLKKAECLKDLIQRDITQGEKIHQREYMHDIGPFDSLLGTIKASASLDSFDEPVWKRWLIHTFFPCFTLNEWEIQMKSFFPVCRYVWDNGLEEGWVDEDNYMDVMRVKALEPFLPYICENYGRCWAQMVLSQQESEKFVFFEEMWMDSMPQGSYSRFLMAARKELSSVAPAQALEFIERFITRQEDSNRPYAISKNLWELLIWKLVSSIWMKMNQKNKQSYLEGFIRRFEERWEEFIAFVSRSDDGILLESEEWDVRSFVKEVKRWLRKHVPSTDSEEA